MYIPSTPGQMARHFLYDASGIIEAGDAAQLVLPEHKSRALFFFQNLSDTAMYIQFGSAKATATLTSGVVTSVAVTNGGFGFSIPPRVEFLGGGTVGWNQNNPTMKTSGQPGSVAPSNKATGNAVLTADEVTSIVIENGGANYANPPYVFITNSLNDPYGCATPSVTDGILVPANGGIIRFDNTCCPTDPVSVVCASNNKAFSCKFMT